MSFPLTEQLLYFTEKKIEKIAKLALLCNKIEIKLLLDYSTSMVLK